MKNKMKINNDYDSIWNKITIPKNICFAIPKEEWKSTQFRKKLLQDTFTFKASVDNEKDVVLILSDKYLTILDKKGVVIKVVLRLAYAKCLWI